MMPARIASALVAALCLWAGGCAAPPTATELELQPGQYAAAFDIAREVLRENRFDLNRVDGRAGVITTYIKPTAGLMSPWDTEQSSFGQEIDDLMDDHQRRVRVTFEPVGAAPAPMAGEAPSGPPTVDLPPVAAGSPTVMRVQAILERVERPIWRPDTSGVGQATRAVDPELVRRGMQPSYAVPVGEDRQLAARLVEEIRRRLAEQSPSGAPQPSAGT